MIPSQAPAHVNNSVLSLNTETMDGLCLKEQTKPAQSLKWNGNRTDIDKDSIASRSFRKSRTASK